MKKKPNRIIRTIGVFAILFVIITVLLYVAYIFNRYIEKEQTELTNEPIIEALTELQVTAEEEHPDLNHNCTIWEQEIKYLRDNFLTDEPTLFQVIDKETWTNELNTLITDLYAANISDEEMAIRIKSIIPKEFHDTAFTSYMKSFEVYLIPGLFTGE